ncbi:hypothetical protein Cenrod_1296 [Candidatus Symbiobacter mobilis CR]|uniref:Uncharacterized protein n=1 Tax=Candidatus Symbiobacter mobilis CR TaxID=946483 RepID=U5N7A4_9BURK|nr:hypothetical protein Cenrod_1296 [Candidatus Symbiobacter mobilis CR]
MGCSEVRPGDKKPRKSASLPPKLLAFPQGGFGYDHLHFRPLPKASPRITWGIFPLPRIPVSAPALCSSSSAG